MPKSSSFQVVPVTGSGSRQIGVESQLSLGMNTQDNKKTLPEGFSQILENVQLDSNGQLRPRLGYKLNNTIKQYTHVPISFNPNNIQGIFHYISGDTETLFSIVDGYLFDSTGNNLNPIININQFTFYQDGKISSNDSGLAKIIQYDNIQKPIGTNIINGVPSYQFQNKGKENLHGEMFQGKLYVPTGDPAIGVIVFDGAIWSQLNPYLPTPSEVKTVGHNMLVPNWPDFVNYNTTTKPGDPAVYVTQPATPSDKVKNYFAGKEQPFGPLSWVATTSQGVGQTPSTTAPITGSNISLNDILISGIPLTPFVSEVPFKSFSTDLAQKFNPSDSPIVDTNPNSVDSHLTLMSESDMFANPISNDFGPDIQHYSGMITGYDLVIGMTSEINGKPVIGTINGRATAANIQTVADLSKIAIIHREQLPVNLYHEDGWTSGFNGYSQDEQHTYLDILQGYNLSDLLIPMRMRDTDYKVQSQITDNLNNLKYWNGASIIYDHRDPYKMTKRFENNFYRGINTLGGQTNINKDENNPKTWPTITGEYLINSNSNALLMNTDFIQEIINTYQTDGIVSSAWVNIFCGFTSSGRVYNENDAKPPNPLKYAPNDKVSTTAVQALNNWEQNILSDMPKNISSFNLAPGINALISYCRQYQIDKLEFANTLKNMYLDLSGMGFESMNKLPGNDVTSGNQHEKIKKFEGTVNIGQAFLRFSLSDATLSSTIAPNLIQNKSDVQYTMSSSTQLGAGVYNESLYYNSGYIGNHKIAGNTKPVFPYGSSSVDFPTSLSFSYNPSTVINGASLVQFFHNNLLFSNAINFNSILPYKLNKSSLNGFNSWASYTYSYFYYPIPDGMDATTLATIMKTVVSPDTSIPTSGSSQQAKDVGEILSGFIPISQDSILQVPMAQGQTDFSQPRDPFYMFNNLVLPIPCDKFVLGIRIADANVNNGATPPSPDIFIYKQLITIDTTSSIVNNIDLIDSKQINSCTRLTFNGQYMVLYHGDIDKRVFFSQIQQPNYIGSNNYIDIDIYHNEKIKDIQYFRNGYIIAADRSLTFWSGATPDKWTFTKINNEVGVYGDNNLIPVENYLAFVSHDGLYFLNSVSVSDTRMNLIRFDTKIRLMIQETNYLNDPLVTVKIAWAKQHLYVWFNNVKDVTDNSRKTICFKYYYLADPSQNDPGWSIETSKVFETIIQAWEFDNRPWFITKDTNGVMRTYFQKSFDPGGLNYDDTETGPVDYEMRVASRGFDITGDMRNKRFKSGLVELVFEPNIQIGSLGDIKTNTNVNIDYTAYVDDNPVNDQSANLPEVINGKITGAYRKQSVMAYGPSVLGNDATSNTVFDASTLGNSSYRIYSWRLTTAKGNYIWFDITFKSAQNEIGLTNFALSRLGFEFMLIPFTSSRFKYNQ